MFFPFSSASSSSLQFLFLLLIFLFLPLSLFLFLLLFLLSIALNQLWFFRLSSPPSSCSPLLHFFSLSVSPFLCFTAPSSFSRLPSVPPLLFLSSSSRLICLPSLSLFPGFLPCLPVSSCLFLSLPVSSSLPLSLRLCCAVPLPDLGLG